MPAVRPDMGRAPAGGVLERVEYRHQVDVAIPVPVVLAEVDGHVGGVEKHLDELVGVVG